jgi:hypothetical protein
MVFLRQTASFSVNQTSVNSENVGVARSITAGGTRAAAISPRPTPGITPTEGVDGRLPNWLALPLPGKNVP